MVHYIYKENYPNYNQYRKAIKRYRERGCPVRNIYGGVACFETYTDLMVWKNQK